MISNRLISSKLHFAFFTASRIAFIGPRPIRAGSTPIEAQDTIFTKGLIDFFSARSKDDNNKAAAPSFIPDEFPAVTLPFSWNTVFNFSKSEIFKLILGCSSLSKIFPS